MSKIALIPILFSLAFAVNASADLIATADCKQLSSPCNSESNVESLLGQDVELVWEAEEGVLSSQIAYLDVDGNPIADPFASDVKTGSWLWSGGGVVLYASAKAANVLNVYDDNSWSFSRGISNLKIWAAAGPAVPEPSAAVVFALGFGMVNAGIRNRARRR